MGNIVLVILFLIVRAFVGSLSQSQKGQKRQPPRTPRTPWGPDWNSMGPAQRQDTETVTRDSQKTLEVSEDFTRIPIKREYSPKTHKKGFVEPKRQIQPEISGGIPGLFTQENILRGIIMQEVLSPPKALRNRNF